MKQREKRLLQSITLLLCLIFTGATAYGEFVSFQYNDEPTILMRINNNGYGVGTTGPFIFDQLFAQQDLNINGFVSCNNYSDFLRFASEDPNIIRIPGDINDNNVIVGGNVEIDPEETNPLLGVSVKPFVSEDLLETARLITIEPKSEWAYSSLAPVGTIGSFIGMNNAGQIVGVLGPYVEGDAPLWYSAMEYNINNYSAMVVDANDAIYLYTSNPVSSITVLNPDGSLKRTFGVPVCDFMSVSTGTENVTLYLAYWDGLFAFDEFGNEKWRFQPPQGAWRHTVGPDGAVYVTDYYSAGPLYALNPDGTVRWDVVVPDGVASMAAAPDGILYAGNSNYLFAVDAANGSVLWSMNLDASRDIVVAPGRVYFGSGGCNNFITAVDTATQTVAWQYFTDNCPSKVVVGTDNTVYFTGGDYLYAVNFDGTSKWTLAHNDFSYRAPVMGTDGTLYVKSRETVVAINPDGTQKWKFFTFNGDGELLVGRQGNIIYTKGYQGLLALDGEAETMAEQHLVLVGGFTCDYEYLWDGVLQENEYEVFNCDGSAFTFPLSVNNNGEIAGPVISIKIPVDFANGILQDLNGDDILTDNGEPAKPGNLVGTTDRVKYIESWGFVKTHGSDNGVYTPINNLNRAAFEADQAAGVVEIYGLFPYTIVDSGDILAAYAETSELISIDEMLGLNGAAIQAINFMRAMPFRQIKSPYVDLSPFQPVQFPHAEVTGMSDINGLGVVSGIFGYDGDPESEVDMLHNPISFVYFPDGCMEDDSGAIDIMGQAACVTGPPDETYLRVPIRIQNAKKPEPVDDGDEMDAIGFEVTYDPAVLEPAETPFDVNGNPELVFEPDGLLAELWFVESNVVFPGVIRIGAVSVDNPIGPETEGILGYLVFRALSTEPTQLNIYNLVGHYEDVPTWPVSGGCIIPSNGDLNFDGQITPVDALGAYQKALDVCPTCVGDCLSTLCDVDNDCQCTAADANCMLLFYVELESCLDWYVQ
ncbi:MAG: PQQ-binding-like beta-propeller repeat protein [Thermodesulfobacteriota bacterium]